MSNMATILAVEAEKWRKIASVLGEENQMLRERVEELEARVCRYAEVAMVIKEEHSPVGGDKSLGGP